MKKGPGNVTEEDWDRMMDVNLKGLFFCCQAAGKFMLKQGCGRIINMSSQASVVGIKDHAVYCAAEAGSMVNGTVLLVDGGWTAQ